MEKYSTPKKMKQVGDLFSKYKTLLKPPQSSVEKACSEAILKVTGHCIDKEKISYTVSTKTIHLMVPSVLKTELRFKNNEILKELEGVLGKDSVPKIIF
ncbi:hypothetical protein KC850_02610 [Candidatus Kaiserbacteria bacterium]|nr:hypothetical protein [Candidatus Kaiserbacteria bacterium]MCB9817965.1 hypothetical protein [Candidatus Nomurabacteria bacterium]